MPGDINSRKASTSGDVGPRGAQPLGDNLEGARPGGITGAMGEQQQPVFHRYLTSQVKAAIDSPR